jgi:hypothetical protein
MPYAPSGSNRNKPTNHNHSSKWSEERAVHLLQTIAVSTRYEYFRILYLKIMSRHLLTSCLCMYECIYYVNKSWHCIKSLLMEAIIVMSLIQLIQCIWVGSCKIGIILWVVWEVSGKWQSDNIHKSHNVYPTSIWWTVEIIILPTFRQIFTIWILKAN